MAQRTKTGQALEGVTIVGFALVDAALLAVIGWGIPDNCGPAIGSVFAVLSSVIWGPIALVAGIVLALMKRDNSVMYALGSTIVLIAALVIDAHLPHADFSRACRIEF